MCGIAGIIAPNAARFRPHIRKMLAALKHRGPDAQTSLEFPNAILAHTRLSIIDLATGDQPMRSALDESVAVTFNGEIYGYQDLREELAPNYPFRTNSDTEIIPALYHAQNDRINDLPGMFAYALWDNRAQTVLLARDRFGEKPLYYAQFSDPDNERHTCLIFASEIKAILATGLISPRLNRDSLAHYLQNLYVGAAGSIYDDIRKIPPAATFRFSVGDIASFPRYYWRIPPVDPNISATDAVEKFRHLLDQSVRRQLVADVPVGAFLSGGLDSSTITALAARHKKEIQTFSFRFDNSLDETPFAAEVAAMHGTTHRVLEDTNVDIAALLLEMASVYDEPFADSSNIPTYLISKLAREHLKVVLTGDGGDELLGGYPWHRDPSLRPRYFSDETLKKFDLDPQRLYRPASALTDPAASMRLDLLDYMPGDILTKIDRASMAHALELRAPFLDVDLASFLISLPSTLKLSATEDKLLLRRAFADLWPASIRTRTKQGFGAPVGEWLRRPAAKKLADSRLLDRAHPLFSVLPFDSTRIAVERLNYQTWILLTLALWLERHPH